MIIHVFALLVLQINSFNNVEESLWGPNDFKGAKESTFHVIDWEFVTSLSRKKWKSVTSMSRKIRISWLLYYKILGCRDLFVTKNGDFVTYLSRKMRISWLSCHEKWGFRDYPVTKNWDFVTYLSRNKLFKSRNSTFTWHFSHEIGYFDEI